MTGPPIAGSGPPWPPCPSFSTEKSARRFRLRCHSAVYGTSYNLTLPCSSPSAPLIAPSSVPPVPPPRHMAGLPLDKAYLTAIWLETLLYGAPIQSLTYLERDLIPLLSRHQFYPLLDLWLRSHQEEKQNPMDHAGRGHLPVDDFYRPCVPRLHCAYILPSPITTAPRILTSPDAAVDIRIHL